MSRTADITDHGSRTTELVSARRIVREDALSREARSLLVVERYSLARLFSSFLSVMSAAAFVHAWTAPEMESLFYVGFASAGLAVYLFVRARRGLEAHLVSEAMAHDAARAREELERLEAQRGPRAPRREGDPRDQPAIWR